jgi:hypothetical protein
MADRGRLLRPILVGLALIALLAGVWVGWLHLRNDPLADVRAYYDAGARLNAGLPLYVQPATPDEAAFYRYPPLLAIAFRPIAALLPYEAAAALWGVLGVALFAHTLVILGLRRWEVWVTAGLLALPIAWSLAVGQAQVEVTWLLALGSPWGVALAANLKVFPALVAVYWLGRRAWRPLAWFAGGMVGLFLFQLVLEPQATIDYLRFLSLDQVGAVNNLSPFGVSPVLWLALLVIGIMVALLLAPSRWGWAASVTLSTVATPRLLSYMLMTLLAALRVPDRDESGTRLRGR